MRRSLAVSLSLILLAACATTRSALNETPQGAPGAAPLFLWKVSPTDGSPGTLWLQGTAHIDRGDQVRLDRAALEALDKADEAVVEIELTPEAMQQIAQAGQAKGLLPEGESLDKQVSAETWALLVSRCEALGLSTKLFERMRPWFAALAVPVFEMKLAGFTDDAGIDRFVFARAREQGKRVRSLETVEFQVDLFAGLTPALQEALLRDGLRESAAGPELLALFEAFRTGDVAGIEKVTFGEMDQKPEFGDLYERVYFARNRTMAESLRAMLREPKSFFVAVGAAHVVGDKGLVRIFEKAGYRVERVAPQGVPEPAAQAQKQWVPIVDDALGYRFELPASPQVQAMPTAPGVAPATSYVLDQGVLAFAVAAAPLPPLPEGFDIGRLLDMAAQGAVTQSGGTLESSETVTFSGADARHVRFTIPAGRAENYVLLRDGALYVLGTVTLGKTRGEDFREPQIRRFFQSFSFAPPASPAP